MEPAVTSYFDKDIENLELSEFEKNGLQVYRNYTKSLTEQRQKEFVAYINAKPSDPAPLEKMLQKILQEDARFLPVIACAFADDQLKDLFAGAIRPGIPGGKTAMLGPYGPLSTFFNRIQLGYRGIPLIERRLRPPHQAGITPLPILPAWHEAPLHQLRTKTSGAAGLFTSLGAVGLPRLEQFGHSFPLVLIARFRITFIFEPFRHQVLILKVFIRCGNHAVRPNQSVLLPI